MRASPALTDRPSASCGVRMWPKSRGTSSVNASRWDVRREPRDEGLVEEIVTSMVKGPPEVGTSMLTDRRAGQLLEANARNGAVVRIGARHGIATPLNGALPALPTAIPQER